MTRVISGRAALPCSSWRLRGPLCGQPAPQAIAGFDAYTNGIESRLARQHQSRDAFLAPATKDPVDEAAPEKRRADRGTADAFRGSGDFRIPASRLARH